MENIFVLIHRFFVRHRTLFWCALATLFLITLLPLSRLHLEEDVSSIIPKDENTRVLTEVFLQSKLLDKMMITVAAKDSLHADPDSLVLITDALANALQTTIPDYISSLTWQANDTAQLQMLETIHAHLPVFLEESDYATIDTLISKAGVEKTLQRNYHALTSPAAIALKQFIAKDPSGISNLALKKLQLLQFDQQFELYDNHFLTRNLRRAILLLSPAYPNSNTGKNAKLLAALDRSIDEIQKAHPGYQVSYFGATAVAVGNALQLRRDTFLTQGITILLLIVFFVVYFRRPAAPLLVLLPAAFGALFALALITLLKGSISVIALGTGSVILGIAVNYSLHVLNHYQHQQDKEILLRDLAHPLTIGSLTTIAGFLCLLFVESEMLQDLGLFGALSLTGASFFSLVFLPQLLSSKQTKHRTANKLERFAGLNFSGNKKLVGLILILTIFFAFFAGNISFESDMNRMNYMSEPLRTAEQEVNALSAFALQSVYLVSSGPTLETALRTNEKAVARLELLVSNGSVRKFSGVHALMVSDSLQAIRIARWNNYWNLEHKQSLQKNLEQEGGAIGFSSTAFLPVQEMLQKNFTAISSDSMAQMGGGMLENYIIRQGPEVKLLTQVKTSAEHKAELNTAFNSDDGIVVLDMHQVTSRLVEMVRKDFNSISWMVAATVFVVLLISMGRIELTLIAFLPMLISWIWILGLMALLSLPFNIVNIIISAIIFGLGDDYSLFTLDGLLQEYKTGRKNQSSFTASIFLSAITTIAGLGVLIFAKHPALRSIALISILGIGSVVLISQVMIPFLFRLLISGRAKKGRQPFTIWTIFTTAFAYFYFVAGAFFLSIVGFLILKLNPVAGDRAKYVYHWMLSKFIRGLMYTMGNLHKKIINPEKENFSKPAVIISNHQSFLDILSIVMQHPKIILMTNDWVWRSPVFGFVVRMADYYPAPKGIEGSLEQLRDKYSKGYSIAVFPEGTRSPDGEMKRFHKGAFFLAEELKADILPIMLHGTGYAITKGDFMVKSSDIIIEYLPRIKNEDLHFGEDYSARTKFVSRYFKTEFKERQLRYEQGKWFRNELLSNYLYKGPTLEWYMRIKTALEKNYQPFIDEVPGNARVLDLGCGYGAMSYMLKFTGKERDITGIDYDEEKILTANHCFSKNDSIRFIKGDVLDFGEAFYDIIIIADVLHYLEPSKQEALLIKSMQQLNPGGKLILREGNSELSELHKRTRLSEIFSTRIIGFNKTSTDKLHFLSSTTIRTIAKEHGFGCREIKDSNFTSNRIFIVERNTIADGT